MMYFVTQSAMNDLLQRNIYLFVLRKEHVLDWVLEELPPSAKSINVVYNVDQQKTSVNDKQLVKI